MQKNETMTNKLIDNYLKINRLDNQSLAQYKNTDHIQVHSGSLFSDFDIFCDVLNHSQDDVVTIYPDYDADGIMGGLATYGMLTTLNIAKDVHLFPSDADHGYGLTPASVDQVLATFPDTTVIYTVDNGINTKEAVDYAATKGICVIITDHHTPELAKFPEKARAVISPNRADKEDTYPFKHIAGAQVTYKALLAFTEKFYPHKVAAVKRFETLSNIAIVTDVMLVIDENRLLLKQCEKNLATIQTIANDQFYDKEASLIAKMILKSFAAFIGHITNQSYVISHKTIGWSIGPKLNAVGRMFSSSKQAFDALIYGFQQPELFTRLDAIHQQQKDEVAYFKQKFVEQLGDNYYETIFIVDSDIRSRLCGLVANGLAEKYHVPTVILGAGGSGSARSPKAYSVHAIITRIKEQQPDLFRTFGGHAQAAGLALVDDPNTYETFKELFKQETAVERLKTDFDERADNQKGIELDADRLPTVEEVEELVAFVEELRPLPVGLAEPKFKLRFSMEQGIPVIAGKLQNHLKFIFPLQDVPFEIVSWGLAEKLQALNRENMVLAVGDLDINEFRGNKNVTLYTDMLSFYEM